MADVNLSDALALRLTDALNSVLSSQPATPLLAMAGYLRQNAGSPPSAAVSTTGTLKPAVAEYMSKNGLVAAIDKACLELKPKLVSGTAADEKALAGEAADLLEKAAGGGNGVPDGEIDYGVHLKAHIEGALVEVLKKCPADPYKAIQQILFQASLDNADPPPAAPRPSSDEVTKFMELYNLENEIEACLFKLKKRCVTGPKDGAKFLVSDAGDFFTEKSKALKAQGGPRGVMTAEELKAADAAAAKAKREKEAKAEAERDAADAENAKKTAEMEAQGKKVSGGLHKFDASEVDINGGSGTADDFMDAFGF